MDTRYIVPSEIQEVIDFAMQALRHEGPVIFKFNSRLRTTMGRAQTIWWGTDVIELSGQLWGRATDAQRRQTIIHEVCHIVANRRSGKAQGHSRAWKLCMRVCGLDPKRCHNVDVGDLRRPFKRRQGSKKCVCGCQDRIHVLGRVRAERLESNPMRFSCRICRQHLRFQDEVRKAA
jgi:predicted SprT family Zn-dependent metalloprotease